MKEKEIGFFVKYNDSNYSVCFETLNRARSDARSKYPNVKLEIYHGTLIRDPEKPDIFDDSGLALIRKPAEKE